MPRRKQTGQDGAVFRAGTWSRRARARARRLRGRGAAEGEVTVAVAWFAEGPAMSNPFDFGADTFPCENCLAFFPKEEAQWLDRRSFKQNVDFPGQLEIRQTEMVVCPACRVVLFRRQWRQKLWRVSKLILTWALGFFVLALAAFGVITLLKRLP
jgi:hypothetical protein